MAIRIKDSLSAFLGDDNADLRFENWLYGWLAAEPDSQLPVKACGMQKSNLRYAMLRDLETRDVTGSMVIHQRSEMLIPKECFDWFDDSKRFLEWFRGTFTKYPFAKGSSQLNISHKGMCILAIDCSPINRDEKAYDISSKMNDWLQKKDIGKHFDWIKESNDEQAVKQAFICAIDFRQNLNYSTTPESHEDLLIRFDWQELTYIEAKTISTNARRKISQSKYKRESKTKKQLNVFISNTSIEKLESICKKHGLSKTKVIEILVESESEKNIYITEKKAAFFRQDF